MLTLVLFSFLLLNYAESASVLITTTITTPAFESLPVVKNSTTESSLNVESRHFMLPFNKQDIKQVDKLELSESKRRSSLTFPYVYPSSPSSSVEVATSSQSGNCICVPSYVCLDNKLVIDIGQLDLKHGWGGYPCGSKHFICCPFPPPPTPPTPIPPSTAYPGYQPRCGTLNPNGINARILGVKESETQFGEYPWMAAILEPINGIPGYKFICGGALVWPSVIISVAHCVYGKTGNKLVVRLGEWDTQSRDEFYPHQDIPVQDIVIHPQYYAGGLYFDVALIFLSSPAILAPHIDTICLPEILPNYANVSCWATGWGKNSFGKPDSSYQEILKEVELPIISKPICQTALRKTNLGSQFNLHPSSLCAGGQKNLDTCVGDGGGGLVCPSTTDPWRYVLAGLVSWGVSCGENGIPGVYVDITKVRSWIDLTISARIPTYDIGRVTVFNDFNNRLG